METLGTQGGVPACRPFCEHYHGGQGPYTVGCDVALLVMVNSLVVSPSLAPKPSGIVLSLC